MGLFRKGKTRIIAKFHRTDLVISGNQLLQLCMARTAMSDSVIRSAKIGTVNINIFLQ